MPEESEQDRLFKQARALVDPLIKIHGRVSVPLDGAVRSRLQHGADLFGKVLQLDPQNWPAMWWAGKVYQRLGDNERAYEFFVCAHAVKPDQPDVAREAALAAMDSGRPSDAIGFCERAIVAKPDDPGLRANLALALLFCEHLEKACAVAEDALKRNPSDLITARLVRICQEVRNGTRACPTHVRDLA